MCEALSFVASRTCIEASALIRGSSQVNLERANEGNEREREREREALYAKISEKDERVQELQQAAQRDTSHKSNVLRLAQVTLTSRIPHTASLLENDSMYVNTEK